MDAVTRDKALVEEMEREMRQAQSSGEMSRFADVVRVRNEALERLAALEDNKDD